VIDGVSTSQPDGYRKRTSSVDLKYLSLVLEPSMFAGGARPM
jgi:hypothetical protein